MTGDGLMTLHLRSDTSTAHAIVLAGFVDKIIRGLKEGSTVCAEWWYYRQFANSLYDMDYGYNSQQLQYDKLL